MVTLGALRLRPRVGDQPVEDSADGKGNSWFGHATASGVVRVDWRASFIVAVSSSWNRFGCARLVILVKK